MNPKELTNEELVQALDDAIKGTSNGIYTTPNSRALLDELMMEYERRGLQKEELEVLV